MNNEVLNSDKSETEAEADSVSRWEPGPDSSADPGEWTYPVGFSFSIKSFFFPLDAGHSSITAGIS